MSSMYTMTKSGPDTGFRPSNSLCMSLSKTKGMTRNSYKPCGVMKAVFSHDVGLIRICQYPEARSRVEKYRHFPNWSSKSSMRGSGYVSALVTALGHR